MLDAAVATGNRAVIDATTVGPATATALAPAARITGDWTAECVDGVLVEGDPQRVIAVTTTVANWPGKIVPVQALGDIDLGMLVHEVSMSINTAAAGGNASLMGLGEG